MIFVKTNGPNLVLLNQLAQVLILSKGYKEGKDPNGTGPYKFLSREKGKTITLVANESYSGGSPKVKKAVFSVLEDEEERISALQSGTVDLTIYGFQKDATTEIEANPNLEVATVPSISVSMLLINQAEGPLTKVNIRQALRKSLNLGEISSQVISGASPASQLVSRLIFGYNPDIDVVEQDQEDAKAVLSKSSITKEQLIILDLPGSENPDNQIVNQFKAVGLNAKLDLVDKEQMYERIAAGTFSFARSSISADTGDASDIFSNFVHSPDEEGIYGGFNFGYTNKEVDKLIEEANQTLDQNTRQEKLQQAMKIAMDEAAIIPLYISDCNYGVRKNIVWEPEPTRMIYIFKMSGREIDLQ